MLVLHIKHQRQGREEMPVLLKGTLAIAPSQFLNLEHPEQVLIRFLALFTM